MSNIPKLRFPEFTDAWEKWELGDFGQTVSGVGFPDREQGNKEGIPFIKVSDMNNIGNENEMINCNNYVTNEQIIKNNWKPIISVPAILFAKVGAAIMLNRKRIISSPFLIDNNMMAYCLTKKLDLFFVKNLFETINLPKYAQTGALPSYNGSDIERIKVFIPTNLLEQQKIGNLFKQLDRLITLHKRKWDDVILLKKALLQKMFPKNGSDFPEIRFSEFTDAWEKCKLGEVANPQQWKTLSSKEMTESGYPVFGANGYIGFYSEYNHEKETIAITCRGATSGSITLVQAKSYITGNSMAIDDLNENICIQDFLLFSLISRGLKDIVSGSAQPQIVKKAIDQVTISYPTLPEQQKIGNLFKQLDRLITLHKRQHEHYQLLKKALLQQMFV